MTSSPTAIAYIYENVGLLGVSSPTAIAYIYEDVLAPVLAADFEIEQPIDMAQAAVGTSPQAAHLQVLASTDNVIDLQTPTGTVAQLGGRARAYFMESSRRLNG